MRLTVTRAKRIRGEFRPPSDKSLTHRAYMLAGIARARSVIHRPLEGEDCESTLACLQAMGVEVRRDHARVEIVPPPEWEDPAGDLDCGNSGTTVRLLAGLVASRPIVARFVGDASLSRRPMRRIADPLRLMGAELEGDTLPLTVRGPENFGERLKGIEYDSPVASAQVKSAILLAGLRADGPTVVREPALSRDHTERMLGWLGAPIVRDGATVRLEGASEIDGFEFTVPGDISSAAFFHIAAAMLPDSEVTARQVTGNETRDGVLGVLVSAGARVSGRTGPFELGEPVEDRTVASAPALKAFEIGGGLVPRLIDEVPILAVLATQCHGASVFRDCQELRVKESDRLAKMADGLRRMGAKIEETPDGLIIEGPTPLTGTTIDASGDHRIAMSFAIAGLVSDGETVIEGAESIATSFPGFEAELERLCER